MSEKKLMADPKDSVIVESVLRATTNYRTTEYSNPQGSVQALELVCAGASYRDVELATGIKFAALMGLRARHATAIEVRRQQLAADGFELAEGVRMLAKEKMVKLAENPKELAKTSLRDLAVSYGVFHDKGLMAAEGNRTIIEHVSKRPTLEDAQKAIEEARAVLQKEAIPI